MTCKGINTEGVRVDPLRGYKFRVSTFPFSICCGFQKVSGLSDESEVAEYRDGCDPVTVRKFPGLVTFENITLERGIDIEGDLTTWRENVVRSDIQSTLAPATDSATFAQFRRTLTIELFDRGSSIPQRVWNIREAWPCKLDDGELDASSSDVMIQSCEVCHEGIERLGPNGEPFAFFDLGNATT